MLIVLLTLALASACGGGSGSSSGGTSSAGTAAPTSISRPFGGAGSLIITKPTGIVEYSVSDGKERPLITPDNASTFLLDPALSPDAKRLTYIVQPPPTVENNKYDAGSDVWVSDRDGGNARVVYAHAQPNQLVRFPQWEDAGHILAVVQEIVTSSGPTKVVYTLERIDATTGDRTKVLEDVLAFTISPDGKRITYAKLAPQTGETLAAADIAGGNEKTLIGFEQDLSPFNSPRYSPDGTKIAIASADQTGARAAFEYVTIDRATAAQVKSVDRAAALDGLPEDIWTIDAVGSTPIRVADLKEDLPALTWSGDGKHIYVVGAAGLYDVVIASGAANRIGEGAFHGQVTWAP